MTKTKDPAVLIAVLDKEIQILEQELEDLKYNKEAAEQRASVEKDPVQRKEWLKTVKKLEKQIRDTESFIIQKIGQMNKLKTQGANNQAA